MIRINLLPYRDIERRVNVKRQVIVYALSVILLIAGMGYFFLKLSGDLSTLEKQEKGLRAELKIYDKTIRKIKEYEKKIKEIKTKLDVIKELEKGKTGPVYLLAEISKAVPKEKLWINALSESKGTLSLQGTAMDNETVALFMTNLEKSEYITSVDLKSTRMRNLPQYKLRVSDFSLSCKTYAFKEKKPESKKRKRGRKRR